MKLKIVTLMTLLTFLGQAVIPSILLAEDNICFPVEEAKKLEINIREDKANLEYYSKSLDVVKQERDLLQLSDELKEKIIKDLELNNKDRQDQLDILRPSYIKANEDLMKEKESKPSRYVWFSAGAITSAILGLVGIFLINK